MYVSQEKINEAIQIFKDHGGVMRTKQAQEAGIYDRTLYTMRDKGKITPLERGLYQLTEMDPLSNPDLVVVAKKIPEARICLISALSFHNLTDEIPHEVHIAIPRTSRDPAFDYPPVQVYRFSESTLAAGIQVHNQDGVELKVFSPAKTVADCFKFRNQIGLTIAVEALKRTLSEKKAMVKEILEYARLCRVEKVMKPYLESITHG